MTAAALVPNGAGAMLLIGAGAVLGTPVARLSGKVFKTWQYDSDGIGNTLVDFARARPELFAGVPLPIEGKRYASVDPLNPEMGGPMVRTYGRAADAVLSGYRVERRGADGVKDGRADVVVRSSTGAIEYAGKPYNYDPAKVMLQDTVAFVGGAVAGYFAVTAAAAAAAGGAGSAAVPTVAEATAAQSGSLIDAAFLDAATAAGTLAPEGVAALIPTGAQLAASGSFLAGAGITAGSAAAGASAGLNIMESLTAKAKQTIGKMLAGKLVQSLAGEPGQVPARVPTVAAASMQPGAGSPLMLAAAVAALLAAVAVL